MHDAAASLILLLFCDSSAGKLLWFVFSLHFLFPGLKVLDANAVPHTGESDESSDTEDASSDGQSYVQAGVFLGLSDGEWLLHGLQLKDLHGFALQAGQDIY